MTRFSVDNSAVVVIDVQNDFCHVEGFHSRNGREVSRTHAPVERLSGFLTSARNLGVPIIFMQNEHHPSTNTAEWQDRHVELRARESCAPGSWGSEFFGVEPQDQDLVLPKSRYNAFTNTELEPALMELGRTSLFFCGVATGICVETSLRDAVCRNFFGTLVDDCCGDYSDESHINAVSSVSRGFGRVLTSQGVLAAWSREPASARG